MKYNSGKVDKLLSKMQSILDKIKAISKDFKTKADYNERCLAIYMNTHISQRDDLSVGDRAMFDHGAKVYCDRRGT